MLDFWESLKYKIKLFFGSLLAGFLSQPLFWLALLVIVGILAVCIFFGAVFSNCGINRLGNTANTAANNQVNLNKQRQEIIANSNQELREIENEKLISNENVRQSLENVNTARNARGNRNVGADELERKAAEY